MERYFPVVSRASTSGATQPRVKKNPPRYQPYWPSYAAQMSTSTANLNKCQSLEAGGKCSFRSMTKFILETLSDETNPITHSDIRQRSDYVFSTSTGHQISEGRAGQGFYAEDRERKLSVQRAPDDGNQILKNVKIYINGFLENTTDIEMKAIILRAGGKVLSSPSMCTHILTSQRLSGSKVHKFLSSKAKNRHHVVKPEWVLDSVKAGKRRPERAYAVIMTSEAKTLQTMLEPKL